MTREEIYEQCLMAIDHEHRLLAELPTGFGKTKMAIDLINHIQEKDRSSLHVLLLVAKNVHKQNWKDEFTKWHLDSSVNVTMDCYESMKKHVNKHYDVIVLDEIHHVKSELRLANLDFISYNYMIGLSATVPKTLRQYLVARKGVTVVQSTLQNAINEEILPEPEIILIPMELDDTKRTETVVLNPKKPTSKVVRDTYDHIRKYDKVRNVRIELAATQKEKLRWYNVQVFNKKRLFMNTYNQGVKFQWLNLAGDRLFYLSNLKTEFVKQILVKLKDKRTLTFCNSINHCEEIGGKPIHSLLKNNEDILRDFNQGKINHISAVRILDEFHMD